MNTLENITINDHLHPPLPRSQLLVVIKAKHVHFGPTISEHVHFGPPISEHVHFGLPISKYLSLSQRYC